MFCSFCIVLLFFFNKKTPELGSFDSMRNILVTVEKLSFFSHIKLK